MNKFSIQTALIPMFLLILLLVAACGRGGGQSGADDVQITLTASPPGEATPYLAVQLADGNGQPITDATVTVEGNMNHAGMVPVLAEPVSDDADGAADGSYRVPFTFTMLGDWIITVSVERADGSEIERNIEANVSEQGIAIE